MTYGLTPTTGSGATKAEFHPSQNTSAESDSCPATTSNGRRLVEVEPASNTSPAGSSPRQPVSFDQRTCQWLEALPSFTGRNATDVNQAANTGKVFEQNGKIPVEFIKEMTNLVLEEGRFSPEELSRLKEEEDALSFLLTPEEVENKDGNSFSLSEEINTADFEVRGVPVKDLEEFTLEPDIEPKAKTFYSFMEGEQDSVKTFLGFGILESGHPFKFEEDYNYSELSSANPPWITIAPDWNSLIDNLDDYDLKEFLENMSQYNSKLLDDWLKITPSGSLNDIRDKLKIVLSPDLLNKFCQQVINRINN